MQLAEFDDSFARVFGDQVGLTTGGDAFFRDFYGAFVAKSPEVARLFSRTDMERQASMLKHSLYEMVTFYATGIASDNLERLAALHHRIGIPGMLYDLWMDALVETAASYDPEFSGETGLAWRVAMAPGLAYFRHHTARD